MNNDLLTKSGIANALGTNPMRVTRFIERSKINSVKKEGKRELFKLTQFNALKKEIESPEAKQEAKNHAFSKDELILTLKQQLEDQKQQYEQVIESKDETIASLKGTIETSQKSYDDMKDQLAVKDGQITALTKLTNNAQTLNMVDKDPKKLQAPDSDAERSKELQEKIDKMEHASLWQRIMRKFD